MSSQVVRNFMKQQGFADEPDALCDMHFSGLYFQPTIVGSLMLLAILLRSPILFLILSAVLWWNVLFPRWNPFELFYNRVIAAPRGKAGLAPAPGPRSFAQGMAASFMLFVAVALLPWLDRDRLGLRSVSGHGLLRALFGKLCLGAYIYLLLCGQRALANSTLSWSRP